MLEEALYKHILVPVDGFETAFKAAKEALKLAKLFGSKTTTLYVVKLRRLKEYEGVEREQVKRKLREFGVKTLEGVKAELIVTGTRGLTGLKRMVLGSTAYRMVEWSNCHIFVVK